MIKRLVAFGAYLLVCLCFVLLAFEVLYRYQVVDLFQPELRASNPAADLKDDGRQTLLAMGDSFSAGRDTWVGFLRSRLPDYRVVSAAVSATGINESLYLAPRRFREFKPSVFIYQVYVGNDLQDIRRPLNWRTMSLPRYAYGFLCSHLELRSLTFANYRLAQLLAGFKSGDARATNAGPQDPPFSPATYPLSVRIYTRAAPADLEDTVLARGGREREVTALVDGIKKLVGYAGANCRNFVVVIPDAGQVNDFYLRHLQQLGARVSRPRELQQDNYPMLVRLKAGLADCPIQVLNPLPLFKKQEEQGQRLYFANDSHLKPVGQTLLGEFIFKRLQAEGLAP